MYTSEPAGDRDSSHEPHIHPLDPDFMATYESIVREIAKPPHVQDRDRVGSWRRADANSVRNYSINGEGYCDLGGRVSCTLTRRDEGLDIAMRPPSIFDTRCQLFFVRYSDRENTRPFVFRTPVMPSHPTESSDIPKLEVLTEQQTQALYGALAAQSVEC